MGKSRKERKGEILMRNINSNKLGIQALSLWYWQSYKQTRKEGGKEGNKWDQELTEKTVQQSSQTEYKDNNLSHTANISLPSHSV